MRRQIIEYIRMTEFREQRGTRVIRSTGVVVEPELNRVFGKASLSK
jgi:hypothetical protein